jgi:NADH-quinone oxidoreductase subunit J
MGILDTVILTLLVLTVLITVMTSSLLQAAIGLAITSAFLTIIMFTMNASLAAVYELSVCAGLIPVIFITVISLTKPLTNDEMKAETREKIGRFWPLPLIFIFAGIVLAYHKVLVSLKLPVHENAWDVRQVVWGVRQLDLIGQLAVLLAGVFAILVLFKEMRKK